MHKKQCNSNVGQQLAVEQQEGDLDGMQWKPDSPTLTFNELQKVTKVKKTKAYRLMGKQYPDYDPDYPQGIPLFDSERSPKFWWTHEALAWSKKREEKARGKQKEKCNA